MRLSSTISYMPVLVWIACAVSMPLSVASGAELSVTVLDEKFHDARIREFIELDQGNLFLRMNGTRALDSAPWSAAGSAAYVLDPSGRVKQRAQTLPWSVDDQVTRYRSAFAISHRVTSECSPRCDNGLEPWQMLAYDGIADEQPTLLYQTQTRSVVDMRVVSAPDAQDLYVLEAGLGWHQLTRINSGGQVVWQQETDWIDRSSFVATNDGIAFIQHTSDPQPALVLKALDRGGRARWVTRLASLSHEQAVFSPAGFITLSTRTIEGRRLASFDADTGKLLSDVPTQPFVYSVGTADGLLLAGLMLGKPYVGMLGRDGKFAWLRRYVPDERINDVQAAVMTRSGRLVLISQKRVASEPTLLTSVIDTDRAAESLAEARGRCLQSQWSQPTEHEARLRALRIRVLPPEVTELSRDDGSCSDHEARFGAFMRNLLEALPPTARLEAEDPRQYVVVQLARAGEPLRLKSYSGTRRGDRLPNVTLSFVAPYDGAAEFGKIVATHVWPHLDAMSALDDHFIQVTGFSYQLDESDLDYRKAFPALEKTARTVNERMSTVAPERLMEARKSGNHYGPFLLRPDGFGWLGGIYPPAEADRAFFAIIEQIRRPP